MSRATHRMLSDVSPTASWTRFFLRYVVAFYLIPVGILIGLCGMAQAFIRLLHPAPPRGTQ